tara:strand:- start:1361 stop:1528 length:168 start_codon:yes stop_codon:yes gene_type:complete
MSDLDIERRELKISDRLLRQYIKRLERLVALGNFRDISLTAAEREIILELDQAGA